MGSLRAAGVRRPNNIGPRATPNYRSSPRRASSRSAARRSSPASATIRSSATSGRSSTCLRSARARATWAAAGLLRRLRRALDRAADPDLAAQRETHDRRLVVDRTPERDPRQQRLGGWTQVSRIGNPLVNEVVVPTPFKDLWNRSRAGERQAVRRDRAQADPREADERPVQGRARAGPRRPRGRLLTGVQGLKFTGPTLADMLRLNYSIPVTPANRMNRLGVIGGTTAGSRTAAASATTSSTPPSRSWPASSREQVPPGTASTPTTGSCSPAFPYVADPQSGFENTKGN